MKTLEIKADNEGTILLELDEGSAGLFLKVTLVDGREMNAISMLLPSFATLQIWMFLDKVVRR